jgi:hypothetical protein
MSDLTGTILEAQPDWLTVSAHGHDAARNLLDLAYTLADGEASKGNRYRAFRLIGYEGHRVGAVEYGERGDDHVILRLIGDVASEHLTVALSAADTVTRLDLALTWRPKKPRPSQGKITYDQAVRFHTEHPKSALPGRFTTEIAAIPTSPGAGPILCSPLQQGSECIALKDKKQAAKYANCWYGSRRRRPSPRALRTG